MGLLKLIDDLSKKITVDLATIKDAIASKNGKIADLHSYKTIPNEVRTLRILGMSQRNYLGKNIIYKYNPNNINDSKITPGRIVINHITNICLCFYYKKDENSGTILGSGYYRFNLKDITKNPRIYDKFYNPDCDVFTVGKYFVYRAVKAGKLVEMYSENGVNWKDINSLVYINNSVGIVGRVCYVTDHTYSILSDDGDVYVYDLNSHQLYEADNITTYTANIILGDDRDSLHCETNSMYASISKNSRSNLLVYSHKSSPLKHLYRRLPELTNIGVDRWIDMICSNQNTIWILGITTDKKYKIIEVIFQYSDDIDLDISIKEILHSDSLLQMNDPDENDIDATYDFSDGKIVPDGNGVRLYTPNCTYFRVENYNSDFSDDWICYELPEDISDTEFISTQLCEYCDGYTVRYSKYDGYIFEKNLSIMGEDVQEGRTYLDFDGTINKGFSSPVLNSFLGMGKCCNVNLDDVTFLQNPALCNSDISGGISFLKVKWYRDRFYLFAIHNRDYLILESMDGHGWKKDISGDNFPLSLTSLSRYDILELDGELYIVSPGYSNLIKLIFSDDWSINGFENLSLQASSNLSSYLGVYEDDIFGFIKSNAGVIIGYDSLSGSFLIAPEDADSKELYRIYPVVDNQSECIIDIKVTEIEAESGDEIFFIKRYYIHRGSIITTPPEHRLKESTRYEKVYRYMDLVICTCDNTRDDHISSCLDVYKLDLDNRILIPLPIKVIADQSTQALVTQRRDPISAMCNNLIIIDDFTNLQPAFIVEILNPSIIRTNLRIRLYRVEDNHLSNNIRYIDCSNGMVFMINSLSIEQSPLPIDTGSNGFKDLTYGDSRYIGITSGNVNKVIYSDDGKTWTVGSKYGKVHCDIVRAIGTIVIAAKKYSLSDMYFLSEDNGENWIESFFPDPWLVQNIEVETVSKTDSGEEIKAFFAFIKNDENEPFNRIYQSNNGYEWFEIDIDMVQPGLELSGWRDITCGDDGRWVAIPENRNIVVFSDDSITWQASSLPCIQQWSSVCYANGYYFAVALNSDRGAMSVDGLHWSEVKLPGKKDWTGCAGGINSFSNTSVFVAIAANDRYYAVGTSPMDLRTAEFAQEPMNFIRIGFQEHRFLIIASDMNACMWSFNGYDWHLSPFNIAANWRYLLYGDGEFKVIDSECRLILSSVDGIKWSIEHIPVGTTIRGIDHHGDKFIVFTLSNDSSGESLDYLGTSDILKEWICSAFDRGYQVFGAVDGTIIHKNTTSSQHWAMTNVPIDSDGKTVSKKWLREDLPESGSWCSFVSNEDKTLIMISNTSQAYLISIDNGVNWMKQFLPVGDWNWIYYISLSTDMGNGVFVLIPFRGSCTAYSTDGFNWKISRFCDEICFVESACADIFHITILTLNDSDDDKTITTYQTYNGIDWFDNSKSLSVMNDMKIQCAVSNYDHRLYALTSHTGNKISIWEVNDVTDTWHMNYIDDNANYQIKSMISYMTKNSKYKTIFIGIRVESDDMSYIVLFSSGDATNWEESSLHIKTTKNSDPTLFYANERIVIIDADMGRGYWSKNLEEWVEFYLPEYTNEHYPSRPSDSIGGDMNIPIKLGAPDPVGLYYDGNRYILFSANRSEYLYSYDCTFWYRIARIDQMLYGNGKFLTIDRSTNVYTETSMMTSTNVLDWVFTKRVFNEVVIDAAYGDGKFVAITNGKTNYVYESADGVNWDKKYIAPLGEKSAIEYGDQGFVITEKNGSYVYLMANRLVSKYYTLDYPINQTAAIYFQGRYMLFDETARKVWEFSGIKSMQYLYHDSMLIPPPLTGNGPYVFRSIGNIAILMYGGTIAITRCDNDGKWTSCRLNTNNKNGILGTAYVNNTIVPIILDPSSSSQFYYFDHMHNQWYRQLIGFKFAIVDNAKYTIENFDMQSIRGICAGNGVTLMIFKHVVAIIPSDIDYADQNITVDVRIITMINRIIDCKYHNGHFIMISETHHLLSQNGIDWKECDKLSSSTNLSYKNTRLDIDGDLTAITVVTSSGRILAYSFDDINWSYIDINEKYGSDVTVNLVNQNLWILRYNSDYIEEVPLWSNFHALSSCGTKRSKDQIIDPRKMNYTRGSFQLNDLCEELDIYTGFKPKMVIIHLVVDDVLRMSFILTDGNELMNSIGDDASDLNAIRVNQNTDNVDEFIICDPGKSRIITNGFHLENIPNGYYIYQAF